MAWIVRSKGLSGADTELPDIPMVAAVRNLVKNHEVLLVNNIASRRVQRHKSGLRGLDLREG